MNRSVIDAFYLSLINPSGRFWISYAFGLNASAGRSNYCNLFRTRSSFRPNRLPTLTFPSLPWSCFRLNQLASAFRSAIKIFSAPNLLELVFYHSSRISRSNSPRPFSKNVLEIVDNLSAHFHEVYGLIDVTLADTLVACAQYLHKGNIRKESDGETNVSPDADCMAVDSSPEPSIPLL
ncbi:hypothetical protein Moror_5663 [Moniliophthora roreri MCA 2997]|uniref:Uncharacterized protein n=1 Tax=Moniliophthora roreri (strain MCA 2997) TaxID=1381753 RepID=V2WQF3_MONRO|nr:hypothetical protein Moror_5663 [Moniliophthora roreri MCA 2997]KAI3619505.1 hypothetical protein WG66_006628 [Moniliophthora roreri]